MAGQSRLCSTSSKAAGPTLARAGSRSGPRLVDLRVANDRETYPVRSVPTSRVQEVESVDQDASRAGPRLRTADKRRVYFDSLDGPAASEVVGQSEPKRGIRVVRPRQVGHPNAPSLVTHAQQRNRPGCRRD